MKPSPRELHELQALDRRLRTFKEANWKGDGLGFALCIIGIGALTALAIIVVTIQIIK